MLKTCDKGTLMRAFRLLLLFVIVLGCRSKTSAPPRKNHDFQQRIQKEIAGSLKAAEEKRCIRPVLRGEPIEARAEEAIVAVVENSSLCRAATDQKVRLKELSFEPWEDQDGQLSKIEKECGAFYKALSHAVAHTDACSPYLFGRRVLSSPYAFIRTRTAITIHARTLAMSGHPTKALQHLLDAVQLGHDLSRGGAPAIIAGTGLAYSNEAIKIAHQVLDHYSDIPGADLDLIAEEISSLLAHPPASAAETLQAEYLSIAIPHTDPAAKHPRRTPLAKKDSFTGDARQDALLVLMAAKKTQKAWAHICPTTIDLTTCQAKLEEARKINGERKGRAARKLEKQYPKKPIPLWDSTREPLVTIVSASFDIAGLTAVEQLIEARVRLSALRLHVELRRMELELGRCPTIADAKGPRLQPMLAPMGLGAQLQVKDSPAGLTIWEPNAPSYRKPLAVPRCWVRD